MEQNDSWQSRFNALFGRDPNDFVSNQAEANGSEVYDENMDFYGESEAQTGAPDTDSDRVDQKPSVQSVQFTAQQTIVPAIDVKVENQRRAELLRAKLLAQRNNTPARQQALSRSNTPTKAMLHVETPVKAPSQRATPAQTPALQQPPSNTPQNMLRNNNTNMSGDEQGEALDLDALLDEGKAVADARSAAMAVSSPAVASPAPTPVPANRIVPLTNSHDNASANTTPNQNNNTAKKEMSTNMSKANELPTPFRVHDPAGRPTEPPQPTDLSDAYYADLPAWLEVTGYHNVEFRSSKLAAYKERKTLEEEAARIADRLEKLRQQEQESVQSLRFSTPKSAAGMAPPPLPSTLAIEKLVGQVNGPKRAHSPEPISTSKRREENGFRIRGVKDSPGTGRPPTNGSRRQVSPSPPPGINRRVSYPEARNRPEDDNRSRDLSLERRQSYYRRESNEPQRRASDYREADREHDYDHYQSRDQRDGPRLGFSTTNMARPGRPGSASQYRGSAGLDLKRGGIRYFMIKSWNHENVLAAQRDNLWATQEKNQALLTEAFNTARHVILLFSVNKSMAFQGYALMTTAPDPRLPKPGSASKLNWKTSPAFQLRWLATTPVHFRLVGHLKNRLNLDERGDSRAVLVGKDGQEISSEAGMGVVWILDEAEVGVGDGKGRKVVSG